MKDTPKAFLDLLDQIKPGLSRAFIESISELTSAAQIALVEDAIRRRDVGEVVRILSIDAGAFGALDRAIQDAFIQGALWQAGVIPEFPFGRGVEKVIVRFDARAPEAERWVRDHSSQLIREIVEDQRSAVRDEVEKHLAAGRNPRVAALDITGRIIDGRRQGGIVGLHSKQVDYVRAARYELNSLSADYFNRKRRDKRFDSTVRKAIKDGKPLGRDRINLIVSRYADRLLKLRGEMIARTETLTSLHAGRLEQVRQMIESGRVTREAVSLVWDDTGDRRTRPAHRAMDGQSIPYGDTFKGPRGSRLKHPGDGSLGAPASMTVACRCHMRVKIDWLSMAT